MVFPARMAPPRLASILVLFLVVLVAACTSPSSAGSLDLATFTLAAFDRTGNCIVDGVVGDCVDGEEEMGMGSETTRRVLKAARRRYISYGALRRNRVPCNRRGRSYYNCRRRGRANPYRRSCTAITRCARDLR